MPEPITIAEFHGDHRALEPLFRLAEDSSLMLDSYIDRGRVWVAMAESGEIVGHALAVADDTGAAWEIVNTAVVASRRGSGIGRGLLERVADEARRSGARRLELATGAADVGNLRFYQRCGFRMSRIVRDAFGADAGYREAIVVDGVVLRDQVWFDLEL